MMSASNRKKTPPESTRKPFCADDRRDGGGLTAMPSDRTETALLAATPPGFHTASAGTGQREARRPDSRLQVYSL